MKNSILLSIILLLFFSSCQNCEDYTDPKCDNYIACENGEVPIVSDFGIGGKLVLESNKFHEKIERYLELDTVLTGTVRLWAKGDYGVNRWSIERDFEIYKEDELLFEFSDQLDGDELIVELEAYTFVDCLSDEDRRDVHAKKIVFKNYQESSGIQLPIYGDYSGAFIGSSDSFILTVDGQGIHNFPELCPASENYREYFDRFFFEADKKFSCSDYYAEGTLSKDQQELTVLVRSEDGDDVIERTFIGKRQ